MDAFGVFCLVMIFALGSVAIFFSIRTSYRAMRRELRKPVSDRMAVGD
jgi:hypothetical protein